MQPSETAVTKAGYIAVVGRPNAGKSTLLNWLAQERLALVSHKANATRKRMQFIIMHENTQLIFVDTPGIHEKERLLNQFMMQEVLKALGDCDFVFFLAPATDSLEHYEHFLELHTKATPHAVLLSKCDTLSNDQLLQKLSEYQRYQDRPTAIIPVSATKNIGYGAILQCASDHLPESPYLYDPDDLTTETLRTIYKEMIRETLFEKLSDEIPYESDVRIEKVEEREKLDTIYAVIVLDKASQKGIVIGKGGANLKRIGQASREKIEQLIQKQVMLKLHVQVEKGWLKNKKGLQEMGYDLD